MSALLRSIPRYESGAEMGVLAAGGFFLTSYGVDGVASTLIFGVFVPQDDRNCLNMASNGPFTKSSSPHPSPT